MGGLGSTRRVANLSIWLWDAIPFRGIVVVNRFQDSITGSPRVEPVERIQVLLQTAQRPYRSSVPSHYPNVIRKGHGSDTESSREKAP